MGEADRFLPNLFFGVKSPGKRRFGGCEALEGGGVGGEQPPPKRDGGKWGRREGGGEEERVGMGVRVPDLGVTI